MSKNSPLVVAITGASGTLYAKRLLETLLNSGVEVHLTLSESAAEVARTECQLPLDANHFEMRQLLPSYTPQQHSRLIWHHHRDYTASIASGSFRTSGMVICPCSTETLAAVAHGLAGNLIQRAAAVHLKERRKLILVPRETPLSGIHLRNMMILAEAGAVILPAMPGFYHQPRTVDDLVDFVVARICDQLGIVHHLMQPWGGTATSPDGDS